jgi:hypothetical protein
MTASRTKFRLALAALTLMTLSSGVAIVATPAPTESATVSHSIYQPGPPAATPALTSDESIRAQYTVKWLQHRGLSRDQAIGVAGSLMFESRLDTTAVQAPTGVHGAAMWPAHEGPKSSILSVQLKYLWNDLNQPANADALLELKDSSDTPGAITAFVRGYLKAGQISLDRRQLWADAVRNVL